MKNTINTIVLFLFSYIIYGQEVTSNDIIIGLYFPSDYVNISVSDSELSELENEIFDDNIARNILSNRLYRVLTENGVASRGTDVYPQFILLPRLSLIEKMILPTAPPKIVVKIELTLHLANGFKGNRFKTHTLLLKGVGENDKLAYVNALKNLNSGDVQIERFIEKGKQRIIEYYNESCDDIIETAKSLKAQQGYEQAWILLASIPSKASCYDQGEIYLLDVYKNYLNTLCNKQLTKAKSIWSTSHHNSESASLAAAILAEINPHAPCFSEVQKLYTEIRETIESEEKISYDRKLKLKQEDSKITDIEEARVKGRKRKVELEEEALKKEDGKKK